MNPHRPVIMKHEYSLCAFVVKLTFHILIINNDFRKSSFHSAGNVSSGFLYIFLHWQFEHNVVFVDSKWFLQQISLQDNLITNPS